LPARVSLPVVRGHCLSACRACLLRLNLVARPPACPHGCRPEAFVFGAAYHATPAEYRNKLGYRWVRESKEAERAGTKKKTFGKTMITNVKPGSKPWDTRRRKQTWSH
jgi:hypothetical protein